MNIEKLLEIEMLYSQYSSLLTPKQRDIVSMYYEEDYSLGEISQILKISRQSVYDSLKRSEASLREYEEKLGLVAKLNKIENLLDKMAEKLDDSEFPENTEESHNQLKELIDQIRELI